jgi:hypothetical protein
LRLESRTRKTASSATYSESRLNVASASWSVFVRKDVVGPRAFAYLLGMRLNFQIASIQSSAGIENKDVVIGRIVVPASQ